MVKKLMLLLFCGLAVVGAAATIEGDGIVCGNKLLRCVGNGCVELLADYKPLSTWYNSKSAFHGVGADGKVAYPVLKDAKWTKAGNGFTFASSVEYKGVSTPYTVVVEALPDDQVKVAVTCAPSLRGQGWKIDHLEYRLDFPGYDLYNQGLSVDGKLHPFPDKPGIILAQPQGMAVLFPNDDRKRFKLATRCGLQGGKTGFKSVMVSVKPVQDKTEFVLDFRGGPKPGDGVRMGGVDFMALEKLELPDYNASRNLFSNPSFEQGMHGLNFLGSMGSWPTSIDDATTMGPCPFSIDASEALFGKHSLRIATLDRDKFKFFWFNLCSMSVPADPGKYTLSFYARCDQPKQFANFTLNLPHTDCSAFVRLEKPLTTKWERYSATFDVKENMPLNVRISAHGLGTVGQVWIDGVQLEKGDKATEFSARPVMGALLTAAEGNFLPIQMRDCVDAKLRLAAAPRAKGTAVVKVKDFFGREEFNGEFPFVCDADGVGWISLPFDGKFDEGVHVVRVAYQLESGGGNYEHHRFSLMNFLHNTHRLKNLFGGAGTLPRTINAKKLPERFQAVGLGAVCWVFDPLHANQLLIEAFQEHGVEMFNAATDCSVGWWSPGPAPKEVDGGYLYATSERELPMSVGKLQDYLEVLNAPDAAVWSRTRGFSDAYLAKLSGIVEAYVRKCPGIKRWGLNGEMLNKLGGELPPEQFERFVKMQLAFHAGVKRANPQAQIYSDAPTHLGALGELSKTFDKLGDRVKYDIVACHAYGGADNLDAQFQAFFEMLASRGYADASLFCPEAMLWGVHDIPQWGFTQSQIMGTGWFAGALSYDMGWTEKLSAAYIARAWLNALKYQDRIECFNSQMGQYTGFALDAELTPYAEQKVPNTLGNLLGDVTFKEDIRFAPNVRCYLFEDAQKRPVAAVYCHHPALDANEMAPPDGLVDFGGLLVEAFDLMGAKLNLAAAADGATKFPVSNFPCFFRGPVGAAERLAAAFRHAAVLDNKGMFSPLLFNAKPSSPDHAVMEVNNLAGEQRGELTVANTPAASMTLKPGSNLSPAFALPTPLRADAIAAEELPVSFTGKTSLKANASFRGLVVKEAKRPIRVDGELGDWEGIPEIPFANATGRAQIASDADLSGSFRVAWGKEGLYLAVAVRDDKFVHVGDQHSKARWDNDCLQIYVDTKANARGRNQEGYDEDDYDFALHPLADGKGAEFYVQTAVNHQLALTGVTPRNDTYLPNVPSAFKLVPGGYVYELLIPFQYLLPAKLEKGWTLGLGLFVADRDDNSKDGHVKKGLTLAPEGRGCYNRPATWPTVLLWD